MKPRKKRTDVFSRLKKTIHRVRLAKNAFTMIATKVYELMNNESQSTKNYVSRRH
jgi:hypothetical protein